jgi:hypothetical protein
MRFNVLHYIAIFRPVIDQRQLFGMCRVQASKFGDVWMSKPGPDCRSFPQNLEIWLYNQSMALV